MSRVLQVELPEEIYQRLAQNAAAAGRRVEDLLQQLIANSAIPAAEPTDTEKQRRRKVFEACFGSWASGDPNSADNERIDADLLKHYSGGLDGGNRE